jgi:hypothetical protein
LSRNTPVLLQRCVLKIQVEQQLNELHHMQGLSNKNSLSQTGVLVTQLLDIQKPEQREILSFQLVVIQTEMEL